MLRSLSEAAERLRGRVSRVASEAAQALRPSLSVLPLQQIPQRKNRRGVPLNEAQIGDYVVKLDDHGLPTTEFTQVTDTSLQTVKEALNEGKMRVAVPLVGFEQPPSQGSARRDRTGNP